MTPTEDSPLDGVRVLEFAHLFPGPYAGLALASLGAEVVKVEPPTGDPARNVPPFVEGSGGGAGAVFCALNRGKKSVQLDLEDEADTRAYREVAATADVVLDGYRPGVAEKLGVGFDELARDDGPVYVRISGFGPEGEWAGEPGHDVTYQAWTGAIDPQAPHLPNLPTADASSALWAACLALAHLGRGPRQLEPSLAGSLQAPAILQDAIAAAGGDEKPLTGDHPGYQIYTCAGGEALALGALEPHFWERLCNVVDDERVRELGNPVDPQDPRRARKLLAEAMAGEPRDRWLSRLREAGVPCAPVRSTKEALQSPLELTSLDPPGVDGPADLEGAPALGEDTEDVVGAVRG